MNSFFYNLGRGTANVVDGTVKATGNAGHAVADAAVSYKRGYVEQTIANRTQMLVASNQVAAA